MSTFILIHGAHHGGWCWEPVATRLRAKGHVAVAPDLPGLGVDPVPADQVNLAMTGDFVADLVRAQSGRVILAGHSMGGIAISEAAERVPDRLTGLVYVAAMLAPGGRTLLETSGHSADAPGLSLSPDGHAMECDPALAAAIFYNRTDAAMTRAAVSQLRPQPIRPLLEPLTVTDARFGRVPRAYIECADDRAISLELQRRMQAALPCDPVLTLETDHSPFFSAPNDLVDGLLAIDAQFAAREAR